MLCAKKLLLLKLMVIRAGVLVDVVLDFAVTVKGFVFSEINVWEKRKIEK